MPFCRQVEPLSDADKYFNMLEWVCRGQSTQQWLAALLSVSEGLSPIAPSKAGMGELPGSRSRACRGHCHFWHMRDHRGC